MDLFDKLSSDGLVGDVRIGLCGDAKRGVLQDRDVRTEIANELSRELALFSYSGGKLSCIVLNVLGRGQEVQMDRHVEYMRTFMWALISTRSFWRCWTIEPSTVRPRLACWSAMARVLSRMP